MTARRARKKPYDMTMGLLGQPTSSAFSTLTEPQGASRQSSTFSSSTSSSSIEVLATTLAKRRSSLHFSSVNYGVIRGLRGVRQGCQLFAIPSHVSRSTRSQFLSRNEMCRHCGRLNSCAGIRQTPTDNELTIKLARRHRNGGHHLKRSLNTTIHTSVFSTQSKREHVTGSPSYTTSTLYFECD